MTLDFIQGMYIDDVRIPKYTPDREYKTTLIGTQLTEVALGGKPQELNISELALKDSVTPLPDIELKAYLSKHHLIDSLNPNIKTDTIDKLLKRFNRYREIDKLFKSGTVTTDFNLESEVKSILSELKQYDLYITKSGILCTIDQHSGIFNSVFFKVNFPSDMKLRGPNAGLIPNEPGYTLDKHAQIMDDELDYVNDYVSKTWLFTNIEEPVHFVDSSNRPGIVRYKSNISKSVYKYLDIPVGAKGIFCIKDTAYAKLKETGKFKFGMDNMGTIEQSYGFHTQMLRELNRVARENIKDRLTNNTMEVIANEFPAMITPQGKDHENPIFTNELLRPTYEKKLEQYEEMATGLATGITNMARLGDHEVLDPNGVPCVSFFNHSAHPWQSDQSNHYKFQLGGLEYKNLLNSGLDRYWYDKVYSNNPTIEKWFRYISNLYGNPNIELYGNHKYLVNTQLLEGNDALDAMTRTYYGNISQNVIKLPNKLDGSEKVYRLDVKTLKDSATNNYYSTKLHSYSDYLEVGNAVPINHGGNGSAEELKYDARRTTAKLRDWLMYKNGLNMQDIVFIPYELLQQGYHYNKDVNMVFTLDSVYPAREIKHPSNKDIEVTSVEDDSAGVVIYSKTLAALHQTAYTKVFNRLLPISIKSEDRYGNSNYIIVNTTSKGKTSKDIVKFTSGSFKEVAAGLGIYITEEEASVHGDLDRAKLELEYRKLHVEHKKLDTEKVKLDTVKLKAEAERDVVQMKLAMAKMEYGRNELEHKYKLENLYITAKEDAMKRNMCLKLLEVKTVMDSLSMLVDTKKLKLDSRKLNMALADKKGLAAYIQNVANTASSATSAIESTMELYNIGKSILTGF